MELVNPVRTYNNPFQNSILNTDSYTFPMSEPEHLEKDPSLQSFTATGRPMPNPADSAKGRAMNSLSSAESFGAGPPNLLPVRFTDDSIISVPVIPPPGTKGKLAAASPFEDEDDEGPVKQPKESGFFSFFQRKSSSTSKKKEEKYDFVMKDVTRGEYLKHYAKDDKGMYVGMEVPATDCLLNDGDMRKYRRGKYRGSATAMGVEGFAFTATPM